MNSFQLFLKGSMLTYPTLFPGTMQVCVHAFLGSGTRMGWVKGRLSDGGKHDSKMDFADLDEDTIRVRRSIKESKRHSECDHFHLLQLKAERMRRLFIEKNINGIVKGYLMGDVCVHDTSMRLSSSELPSGVSYEYAPFFNYPDTIAKDWAAGMVEFSDKWLVALNYKYGISPKSELTCEEATNHWPEDAKTLRTRILATSKDLRCKALGITPEQLAEREKRTNAMVRKIIAELKREKA